MNDRVSCVVIIVTFNGAEYIGSCIESIKLNGVKPSIVVVDNNSTDGTKERVGAQFPDVHIISLDQNYGFALANNIGIQHALRHLNPDYFFLFNQDILVHDGCLEVLIEALQNHAEYGILSPLHLNESGQLDVNFGRHIGHLDVTTLTASIAKANPCEVSFVNAAAWCLSRHCIETIGGFDTSLFRHYGEDDNYCQRVRYHGLQIGIVPQASVIHYRQNTASQQSDIFLIEKAFIADLVRCADINQSDVTFEKHYQTRTTNYFLILLKSLVTLNWQKTKWLLQKSNRRKIFNKPVIVASRHINRQKGCHWLPSTNNDHLAPLTGEKPVS